MRTKLRGVLAVLFLTLSTGMALSDDWEAVRLRGQVLQLVEGEWQKLSRGDKVPDSRAIRTLHNGSVEFQRGEESVTLGIDTQIQIYDKVSKRPFTTVKQYFGAVTVEAEVQQVQHFAVQTPYLAAVVKGTKFTVTSGDKGASVTVHRGSVLVEESKSRNNVTITAGQSASVEQGSDRPIVSGGASRILSDLLPPKPALADEPEDPSYLDDESGILPKPSDLPKLPKLGDLPKLPKLGEARRRGDRATTPG